MSSGADEAGERRANSDRRSVADRRNEEERRNESDRRNMLAGLGGKIVAAPQQRDALRDSHVGIPGMPRSSPSSLQYIHPEGSFGAGAKVPLSPAVKAGNLVYVSGIPGYDEKGKLAVGDFAAQMKQTMDNIAAILEAAGTDWAHVMKANVLLTRREDFAEMNRIYSGYFQAGKFPARTTAIVYSLPYPDFLLEIECVAMLG